MPPIGKNSDLVNLLHAKTKIKKPDIIDLLRAMPECMAEAFIMSNADEKKTVEFGGIAIFWHSGGKYGSSLKVKVNEAFKRHYNWLKVQEKHPLAVRLCKLMLPINRERALNRSKSINIIKSTDIPLIRK